ncbi:MAG: sugar phosphate isomerase/epimerase [Candidatus Poribacteria bacterium]|nr:sugar phosphate isomerase/epimerase [Candidatus Poribacteria bacterium]
MKIAMHNWMRPEPLETTVARLSDCGYDEIEISGEPDKFDVDETRAILDKYGIGCWGAVSIMTEGRGLTLGDKYLREGSIQYLQDCARMVGGLGGKILTTVPATVGKISPDASIEEEWDWTVDGLKRVADVARECGVTIAIEPINRFETYFINRGDQALALAEAVGEDICVCLDAFHMNIEETDALAAIREAGGKLIDFHVADTNRRPPGEGHYDWAGTIETLQEIGYEGRLTVEFVNPIERTILGAGREAASAEGASAAELKFIEDHGGGVLTDEEYTEATRSSIDYLKSLLP